MLQKFKNTSYTFIFFLVFAFSFIALQVTTEEVEAAPGVCEPVERIRNMKDTARHSDYKVWEERCQVSGSNGQCGNRTEWPAGDGGRCETTAAEAQAAAESEAARLAAEAEAARLAAEAEAARLAAQDVNPPAAPGAVCHPSDYITAMYNTKLHLNWENAQERCEREGVNAEVCATG